MGETAYTGKARTACCGYSDGYVPSPALHAKVSDIISGKSPGNAVSSAVNTIVHILRESDSPDVKVGCAKVLANLTRYSTLVFSLVQPRLNNAQGHVHAEIHQTDAISILESLCRHPDDSICHKGEIIVQCLNRLK